MTAMSLVLAALLLALAPPARAQEPRHDRAPVRRGGVYDKPYLTRLLGRTAIGGYAEAHARWERVDGCREEAGFEAKRFNLFTNTRVSDFVRIGAELEFEDGGEEIKLEYAAIDVAHPPALALRGGDAALAARPVQPGARQSAQRVHRSAARLHGAARRRAVGAGLRRARAVRPRQRGARLTYELYADERIPRRADRRIGGRHAHSARARQLRGQQRRRRRSSAGSPWSPRRRSRDRRLGAPRRVQRVQRWRARPSTSGATSRSRRSTPRRGCRADRRGG